MKTYCKIKTNYDISVIKTNEEFDVSANFGTPDYEERTVEVVDVITDRGCYGVICIAPWRDIPITFWLNKQNYNKAKQYFWEE